MLFPWLGERAFIEVEGSSSAYENIISCHEAKIRRTEEQVSSHCCVRKQPFQQSSQWVSVFTYERAVGTDPRGWGPGWGSSLPRFWEDWTPHCERRPWPCGFCGFSCCLTRKSACSGPFSASGRERVMYDANQCPWKCGARLHQRPASLLWVRCCCGAVTWTPRGCLGLSSCIPKSWCSVAPRCPGEVVHPVAAWATPTEGHEEWSPLESLLMAVYRFPGHVGCI